MFAAIDPEQSSGRTKELLEATHRQLGRIPNLYRTMANSPTTLAAYLAFRDVLQRGELDVAMRERVALLTAALNSCDYCVAAHSFRSQKIGLTAIDIENTRRGRSEDLAVDALLKFVVEMIEHRGEIGGEALQRLAEHGWSEAAIGEVIAHVALNIFSNYFKHVAHPELDFPAAPEPSDATAEDVRYTVDASAVAGQWSVRSKFDFDATIGVLKQAIAAQDLLLIGEIDPRKILMSAGLSLRPARQLLFFHPRYMKRLLEADARAVSEVPLKIVVLESHDGSVVLRGPDVTRSFACYRGLDELAEELEAVRAKIVSTIAIGSRE
jgi:uncharacterized peroxidase-related enzyme